MQMRYFTFICRRRRWCFRETISVVYTTTVNVMEFGSTEAKARTSYRYLEENQICEITEPFWSPGITQSFAGDEKTKKKLKTVSLKIFEVFETWCHLVIVNTYEVDGSVLRQLREGTGHLEFSSISLGDRISSLGYQSQFHCTRGCLRYKFVFCTAVRAVGIW